jgi:hypothetical protein
MTKQAPQPGFKTEFIDSKDRDILNSIEAIESLEFLFEIRYGGKKSGGKR